ncbi:MAG: sugar ABC transporter ATP-binding protein [Treponemataceae bacterium]
MSEVLLKAEGVSKFFPGTVALNKIQLEVVKGEVHALCGENGAGKSTLMNIIGAVFPPCEGNLYFEGNKINLTNPKEAQELGIGFVHQELNLCTHLTVAENIFIGRLPRKNGLIDFKRLFAEADAVLSQFGANFKSKALISELTVSEQQIVEISKSVSMNCKLLILDEPTSSLTDKETNKLFEVVSKLKSQGISILYISHRMAEIFRICDRVTVFKDGCYVTTMETKDITADDIIKAMVGREITTLYPPKSSKIYNENILEIKDMSGDIFHHVSFNLKKGEILGFAGLVGAGRSELMRGFCAIDKIKSGTVLLNGEKVAFSHYRHAVDAGVCYLTEDRKTQGLFLDMSIENNISSANLKEISQSIWIKSEKEKDLADFHVKKLSVKIPGIKYKISSLSGGNQQKCLIGKWLSLDPKVIIMDEPTRGIDIGAKSEIHALLRHLAESGIGVIVVSSELPEVIGISDRVAVMHEGNLEGILENDNITEENIMKLASGQTI